MMDKLKIICDLYRAENNNVMLFAVLKLDDLVDKWSIFLGTKKELNQDERSVEYTRLVELSSKNLDDNEMNSIARVGFMSRDAHLIEELAKFQSGSKIENTKVNGNFIFEGHILYADPLS